MVSKNVSKYIYIIILLVLAPTLRAQTQSSDSVVLNVMQNYCKTMPATHNNSVKIFKSGAAKFEAMFADIRNAKHSVHLDYFNFRNDSIGNALFDLLAEKAREGVEVRAIFDAFGNSSNNKPLKKEHMKKIRENGIEIIKFRSAKFPYLHDFFDRDHRKIVVIDGEIAYTGGMNVADYYIEGLPEIGAWRDIHMRIEGSAVAQLQTMFLALWNKAAKQNVGGAEYFPPVKLSPNNDKTLVVVDRTPYKTPSQIRCVYTAAINNAQKSIKIVNPYFVPTHKVKRALKNAIKRGIDVEIMISSKSDIPFTPEASKYVAHTLMKRGAKIYFFNGGFHHSKIMMIDDLFCTVGSANLDSRSLRCDYEVNTFIFDKSTTSELTQMFESDKAQSTFLTPEVWKQRPCQKKIIGWFARAFTPFL